jgi:transposase
MFQKDSTLAQWFRARTENARSTRKTMIVAVARSVVPDGVVLRPVS